LFFASGSHPPLLIAVIIIVVVVGLKVLLSWRRGGPALGGNVVVRCSRGHVFTARWSPLGSLTSVRLGSARFGRCPVGHHWSLLRPMKDSDLTDEDRRLAAQTRR
jgi:hypothetical protein